MLCNPDTEIHFRREVGSCKNCCYVEFVICLVWDQLRQLPASSLDQNRKEKAVDMCYLTQKSILNSSLGYSETGMLEMAL